MRQLHLPVSPSSSFTPGAFFINHIYHKVLSLSLTMRLITNHKYSTGQSRLCVCLLSGSQRVCQDNPHSSLWFLHTDPSRPTRTWARAYRPRSRQRRSGRSRPRRPCRRACSHRAGSRARGSRAPSRRYRSGSRPGRYGRRYTHAAMRKESS